MNTVFAPDLQFIGPPPSEGPLPAIFYFALSSHDSLHLDPFNQPVEIWKNHPVRVFSLNLPAHGPEEDKMEAMNVWAEGLRTNPNDYFTPFFFRFSAVLDQLSEILLPGHIGVAGLSRGGFVAAHLAARFPAISSVLGFAPATSLTELEGFPSTSAQYDLVHLIPQLLNKKIKFFIGNHDLRVNTASAFNFCSQLAEYKFQQGERSPQVEMSIYPSIGHKGHGTPPHIFREGAQWILNSFTK